MLLAEGVVTKDYWEPIFNHIKSCFRRGVYEPLRGIPIFKMTYRQSLIYVAACEDGGKMEVYGWLVLDKKRNWKALQVGQSYVFPAARGAGWGKLLYDTVICREGIILASGYTQSRSSRGMWKNFIRDDKYTIWAHDFAKPTRYAPVIYDEGDDSIWSPLPIYQTTAYFKQWKQDIRLIAIRKRK